MNYFVSHIRRQEGLVGLYLTIIVLVLMLGIIVSIGFGVVVQQWMLLNITQSAQAYFAAESGIEDAILRLQKSWGWIRPYTMPVGSASVEVTISDIIGGSRTIDVEGDAQKRFRSLQIVYQLVPSGSASFAYGAQVGDAGLVMRPNSYIEGNVFSNGDIVLDENAVIENSVVVAGNHTLSGCDVTDPDCTNTHPFVREDATADTCANNIKILGLLTADNIGPNCDAGSTASLGGTPPDPIPLPIDSDQIDEWKTEAASGGIIPGDVNGDVIISWTGGPPTSLGPGQITGDFVVENQARVILTGNLWVQGNVDIKNQAGAQYQPAVSLSPGYGGSSGMIIADGTILLENNSQSVGSGESGSYLMYLSTYTSSGQNNPAIQIDNNADADILYANNGWVRIVNNAETREVTGFGVELRNTAELHYEIGLQDTEFSNGPAGGWKVISWKEIP